MRRSSRGDTGLAFCLCEGLTGRDLPIHWSTWPQRTNLALMQISALSQDLPGGAPSPSLLWTKKEVSTYKEMTKRGVNVGCHDLGCILASWAMDRLLFATTLSLENCRAINNNNFRLPGGREASFYPIGM